MSASHFLPLQNFDHLDGAVHLVEHQLSRERVSREQFLADALREFLSGFMTEGAE